MSIRWLSQEDVPAVAENEGLCFSQPWSEEAFLDAWQRQTASKVQQMLYLVAECDGRIVGHCGIRNIVGEGEITNVAVHPDYRGRGIAARMVGQLIREGERLGDTAFTLEVRAGNAPAIRLYQKLGFVTEGVRKDFYEKPVEDALIMWKR